MCTCPILYRNDSVHVIGERKHSPTSYVVGPGENSLGKGSKRFVPLTKEIMTEDFILIGLYVAGPKRKEHKFKVGLYFPTLVN